MKVIIIKIQYDDSSVNKHDNAYFAPLGYYLKAGYAREDAKRTGCMLIETVFVSLGFRLKMATALMGMDVDPNKRIQQL